MPTYRIALSRYVKMTQTATVDVEADNEDEAQEIACDLDFIPWRQAKLHDCDGYETEVVEERPS